MELFGIRLKALRAQKDLTQNQLAQKLDITRSSVSYYEKGAIYPSVDILVKICRFFNVSADFLLGLSEGKEFHISHLTDEQVSIIINTIHQFEQLNS